MLPPPSAGLSIAEVARIYAEKNFQIKLGSTICSWSSAFMMPLWIVVALQIRRQEPGRPIWTCMAMFAGCVNTVVLALPPVAFGVAAFDPTRSAEITAAFHQFGVYTFVSTDQWYMFSWLAVTVICLRPQLAPHSPFPRWFGYFSAFVFVCTFPGGLVFLFQDGPLSWNGLFIFWIPAVEFIIWELIMSALLLRAIGQQRRAALDAPAEPAPTAVPVTG
jgi:hypothetical protein